jgi:hypothetical protein
MRGFGSLPSTSVFSCAILCDRVQSCAIVCCLSLPKTYQNMNPETQSQALFDEKFKPRLENQLSCLHGNLLSKEKAQALKWVELYREGDPFPSNKSRSTLCLKRRSREFAQSVLAIGNDLFVLCSLSLHVSRLPTIPHGSFYDRLGEWWAHRTTPDSLVKATEVICGLLFCKEQLYSGARADFLSSRRKYGNDAEQCPSNQPSIGVALSQSVTELARDERSGTPRDTVQRIYHNSMITCVTPLGKLHCSMG